MYTPGAADVGQKLRVRVGYADGHSAGKQAVSAETDPVAPVPPPARWFRAGGRWGCLGAQRRNINELR